MPAASAPPRCSSRCHQTGTHLPARRPPCGSLSTRPAPTPAGRSAPRPNPSPGQPWLPRRRPGPTSTPVARAWCQAGRRAQRRLGCLAAAWRSPGRSSAVRGCSCDGDRGRSPRGRSWGRTREARRWPSVPRRRRGGHRPIRSTAAFRQSGPGPGVAGTPGGPTVRWRTSPRPLPMPG